MVHKGKDIDQAIKEAFLFLMADEHRMAGTDSADFKRLVNTWLSKQRPERKAKDWKL